MWRLTTTIEMGFSGPIHLSDVFCIYKTLLFFPSPFFFSNHLKRDPFFAKKNRYFLFMFSPMISIQSSTNFADHKIKYIDLYKDRIVFQGLQLRLQQKLTNFGWTYSVRNTLLLQILTRSAISHFVMASICTFARKCRLECSSVVPGMCVLISASYWYSYVLPGT